MTTPAIFHLSFPVASLDTSLDFYTRCFGATLGRRTDAWCDVLLFGHQLTLHEQPAQVQPRAERGVRHFGAILSLEVFDGVRERIASSDFRALPTLLLRDEGQMTEHAKLLIEDPDGYLIELKAYRSLATIAADLAPR